MFPSQDGFHYTTLDYRRDLQRIQCLINVSARVSFSAPLNLQGIVNTTLQPVTPGRNAIAETNPAW